MDTEEGVEVVWNEVLLQNWDKKQSKAREDKIKLALDRLIQLDHPNIVKLHKYWTDINEDKARVIFITEYMSSGSLKQFLKKTKRNVIKMALPVSSFFLAISNLVLSNINLLSLSYIVLETVVHPDLVGPLLLALVVPSDHTRQSDLRHNFH